MKNFLKLSIKNIGTYIGNIVTKKLYNIDLKVLKSILLSMLQFWLISSDERIKVNYIFPMFDSSMERM